jgi:hypothetical protein
MAMENVTQKFKWTLKIYEGPSWDWSSGLSLHVDLQVYSSFWKEHIASILGLEDGGSMFLRNVDIHL